MQAAINSQLANLKSHIMQLDGELFEARQALEKAQAGGRDRDALKAEVAALTAKLAVQGRQEAGEEAAAQLAALQQQLAAAQQRLAEKEAEAVPSKRRRAGP